MRPTCPSDTYVSNSNANEHSESNSPMLNTVKGSSIGYEKVPTLKQVNQKFENFKLPKSNHLNLGSAKQELHVKMFVQSPPQIGPAPLSTRQANGGQVY